ncbi:MAG: beta-hydroxyacyl-ACP dehydratase [Bacteroidales bacterium]
MLGKELYQLIESTNGENKYTYQVELNAKHPIYKGHFPTMPILPGVCTLQIIKECLSKSMGCAIRVQSIKECKFLAPIHPSVNKVLVIEAELREENLSCTVRSKETIMLKLRGSITQ